MWALYSSVTLVLVCIVNGEDEYLREYYSYNRPIKSFRDLNKHEIYIQM